MLQKMSLSYILYYINVIVFVVGSIAFYTLMERKLLSYHQNRMGPNLILYKGLLQPVSDALKLMTKMEFSFFISNFFLYWFFPFLSFFMMLFLWSFYVLFSGISEFNYSSFFFLFVISISSYGLILMAWSSNSKYSTMGGYRAMAQTISYETILFLCFFIFFILYKTYSLIGMILYQMMGFFFILFVFVFSLVCEVNRAPVDLAEGESELVSGFNVEYGGLKFAVIFLSEYGMMIFMSFLVSIFFNFNLSTMNFFLVFFMLFFLWLRSSFPRLRFDYLMQFTWMILINYTIMFSFFFLLIL